MTEVSRLIEAYVRDAKPKGPPPHEETHSHRCESCGGELPEELPEEAPAKEVDPDTKAALFEKALREQKT